MRILRLNDGEKVLRKIINISLQLIMRSEYVNSVKCRIPLKLIDQDQSKK